MQKIGEIFFNLKQFYLINFLFDWFYEEKTSQKFEKIHSQRESSNSPGSLGFEKTRRINKGTLQKISKK